MLLMLPVRRSRTGVNPREMACTGWTRMEEAIQMHSWPTVTWRWLNSIISKYIILGRGRNNCYLYCAENGPNVLFIWTLFKLTTNLNILRFCDYSIFIHVIRCGSSHQLPGHLNIRTFSRRWLVLAGPGWWKPFKCIPGLLWHDVLQWRMDHVLHYWWRCQTQDWSYIQRSVSLWKWRLQDQL